MLGRFVKMLVQISRDDAHNLSMCFSMDLIFVLILLTITSGVFYIYLAEKSLRETNVKRIKGFFKYKL